MNATNAARNERRTLHALGNPSDQTLVIGGMLALVGVYLIKGILTQTIAHD